MLDYLIKKYKDESKDKKEVVYKLTYAGKFIIVKGKTLCGSLIIMRDAFEQFKNKSYYENKIAHKKRWNDHIYKHWFNHFLYHKGKSYKFRIRVLYKIDDSKEGSKSYLQYRLLKTEQNQIDKYRYDKNCLNNSLEAYIPAYNETLDSFGWLNKSAVMNFKRYLNSKTREAYMKRYSKK